jgi:Ca2+-binding RTX toxin-like protein
MQVASNAMQSTSVTAVTRFLPGRHHRAIALNYGAAVGISPAITETQHRRQTMAYYIGGTAGNDTLLGTTSYDAMYSHGGNDVLVSSPRSDTMNGGTGADRFDFNSVGEAFYDVIADFHWWEGDKVDVSTIDAKDYSWSSSSTWGNNTFTFKGNVNDGGLGKGELGYSFIYNGNTMIYGNTDGDSSPELAIQVSGTHYFNASDFVL